MTILKSKNLKDSSSKLSFMTASAEKYGLSVGEKAPDFSTVDTAKNEVSLEALLKNNKGVLINFFRGSW